MITMNDAARLAPAHEETPVNLTPQELYNEMARLGTDNLDVAKRSLTRARLLKLATQAKSTADLRAVVIKIIQELYA